MAADKKGRIAKKRVSAEAGQPPLAKPVDHVPEGSLAALRRQASDCKACPLWRNATQTVFGTGASRAVAMLIGEQPGAQEDVAGKPFVGPAGKLLRAALDAAGVGYRDLYVTNTVKHFKFERRGKARLHKRATASEQAACRPWLAAELLRVQPSLVVALGAMAAQTLFGGDFRLTVERGKWKPLGDGRRAMATWHPSALLRMPSPGRERAHREFFADIEALADAMRRPQR
jgi:uracil-DNA glycosylase family protein